MTKTTHRPTMNPIPNRPTKPSHPLNPMPNKKV